MGRKRKKETTSAFGTLASELLAKGGASQTWLADNTGKKVSYVNQIITGHRPPNAEWAKLAASVLDVSPADKQRFYSAAAEEYLKHGGFDIDLTKKD